MTQEMEKLQDLAIDYLLDTPTGKSLQEAITVFERVQEKVVAYAESPDDDTLKKMKVGTILTMAVLTKMSGGLSPKDFAKEDWMEIGDKVKEYALDLEPEQYSKLVFMLYAGYIESSAQLISDRISTDAMEKLAIIVTALRDKSDLLSRGEIRETDYIEDCLWLCLEAMIKLISSYMTAHISDEYAVLADAVTTYAFEYGRLMLYQKERALIEEYLAHQKVLDEELQAQYEAYLRLLEEDQKEFRQLVDRAFDPDFSNLLKNSVALAKATGVKENEILDSIEKIDDFFS